MSLITALYLALGLFTAYYLVVFTRGLKQMTARGDEIKPSVIGIATGAVTNFFDTLGIGSYATTTTIFRSTKQVRDEKIPGTLNVGHTLPTVVEAMVYVSLFQTAVDATTLVEMIVAAVAGAWLGARVFGRWPRRKIQIGMGLALLGAAALFLMTQLNLFPAGGDTLGLSGIRLGVGLAGNFVLGVLMMLGIGLYGPCMILVSLLGMNPTAAFPIMMGSCAFLMPIASMRFVRTRTYHKQAAWGLAIGAVPAVLIAAYVVTSLSLTAVRWLVIVVVVYTSLNMLLTASAEASKA